MPGSWQPLNNQPTFNVDAMLLLTDGGIMCHEDPTPNWHKLVPDKNSNYANGTWHKLSPMPNNAPVFQNGPVNAPLYFASAVLRDGTIFCAGGELNVNTLADVELLAAELYDPVADVWTPIATPVGWTQIGDASSCVFPDGRVLLGNDNGNSLPQATAIWDPESRTWSAGGDSLDLNSEEGWTLLPDGTILAVQCTDVPNAQKYVIATNEWVSAGTPLELLPADPEVAIGGTIYEMGPQVLRPDGTVFAIGAGGLTGIYTPPTTVPSDPGSWANGPSFPPDATGTLLGAVDAPACLLPNGNVLCVVGTVQTAADPEPGQTFAVQFFEFDGVALNPVPGTASASAAYTVQHPPAVAANRPGAVFHLYRGSANLHAIWRSVARLEAAHYSRPAGITSGPGLPIARTAIKRPVPGLRLWRRPADGDQLSIGASARKARRRRCILPDV